MKVLLISANTEMLFMPALPLGPACMAAATRQAGHEVALLDLMFAREGAISDTIAGFRPDVIGVSVRNIDDQCMQETKFLLPPVGDVVAACRALSRAPIILGGAGYSIFPESALRYLEADAGIQGEGEAVFPLLLARIVSGERIVDVPSVYTATRRPRERSFLRELDDAPLPEANLLIPRIPGREALWVPVQTRRGCPLDCSYCSTSLIEGRSIRKRSVERVVDWMAALRDGGWRRFHFVDNTFNLPPWYAKKLCRQIVDRRLEIEFWCIVYPKWVDAELVELMKEAGCSLISLGFETGAEAVLRSLNKRFEAAEVSAISKMFRDVGIARNGFLLLGAPGETKETVEESLAFAGSLGLEALKVSAGVRIYPHTPLAKTAVAEGLVEADDDLLRPRFYITPDLREWLPERVAGLDSSGCGGQEPAPAPTVS